MMRMFLASAAFVCALSADAQIPTSQERGDRDGSRAYGSAPMEVVNRVQSDVRRIASTSSSWGKNERKHFEEVDEELGKFTRKYREGTYDRDNLKDAAESLLALTRSSAIQSREQRILSDALTAVQRLRTGEYNADSR